MQIHRGTIRGRALLGVAAATTVALSGCGIGNNGDSADGIIVGTTDQVVSIDPAGAYDQGSSQVQTQVFQYLMNFPAGSNELTPDAAEECDFASAKEYVCTLKEGLTFANGNELTASDVAFSFQRIVDINDPNGPASLLGAMEKVEATGDLEVTFTLTEADDQTFPQVLVTSAGPIVDEDTYPADEVLDDDAAVEAEGFSGPFTIGKYSKNEVAEFVRNDDYDGAFDAAEAEKVTMTYYADSNNLKLDIENDKIDVAWRSLTPTDIESLEDTDGVEVHQGAGGELRYIVLNLKTMPGDDEEAKLAVRQAMAASIDRDELAEQVYKGTYTPAYSIVPQGQTGATEPFKERYGDGPDKSAAQKILDDAGVETPVALNLQYNTDHYGSNSDQEYAMVKRQLDASGLFEVNLQSTEWNTYQEERVEDAYPAYQLGWFPDFPDADNYLTPFLGKNNFLQSHYDDKTTQKMLTDERTETDEAERERKLGLVQDRVAEQVPVLPLLTGSQVAVAGDDIDGVEDTLDAAFKFRFTSLSKG